MSDKVMLSAVQPTKKMTLGNYLGATKNWVELQDQYRCIFFMVDLHAITVRQDPEELREASYFGIASYIAAGIDPDKCLLFTQSHVPQHAELAWILNCFTYMGELNRMTQFKDKSARAGKNIAVGLFDYPVLMASDILLYDSDLIPVGQDQKQHVELTRDVAERMNNHYNKKLFKVPEPYIPKVGARIMDLQEPTNKMSKSASAEGGAVYLADTDKQIEKKIKRATTDSGDTIKYSDDQPGVRNLIEIQCAITKKTPDQIEKEFEGKQYGHLKVATAEIVVEALRPIREEVERLMKDKGYLDGVLKKGAEEARDLASKKIKQVYDTIGFIS